MIKVLNGDGDTVSIDVPEGCVALIARAGATIRGTTYFQPALITVSDAFAEYLVEQGAATYAEAAN